MGKPTITSLRKLYRELTFDPKKPGPLSLILDAANPQYFLMRAQECIRVTLKAKADKMPHLAKANMHNAIHLVAMALLTEEATDATTQGKVKQGRQRKHPRDAEKLQENGKAGDQQAQVNSSGAPTSDRSGVP